jgi:hypothetical protein
MVVQVRRTLAWATAVAAVVSATLLTSTGGGLPRIGGDFARSRVAPLEQPRAPGGADFRDHSAPGPAGSAH